jgi:Right handed beta helix region
VRGCTGSGIRALHARTRVELVDSAVEDCGASGVDISVMAHAALTRCSLSRNGVAGLHITVRLCVFVNNLFLRCVCSCVSPSSARLILKPCDQHSWQHLMFHVRLQGADTRASLEECQLSHNATLGIFVSKGARAALSRCSLTDNRSTGAEVGGRGSVATCSECTYKDNGRVDLYVHSAALAQLRHSRVGAGTECAVLCGGVTDTGLAGGLVEHCPACMMDGRLLSRHGGRVRGMIVDDVC